MSINYRERLERVKFYREQGDYQVVVRECGTLLETALRASYARLLALTPEAKMDRVRKVEGQICREGQTYEQLGLGSMIRLMRDGQIFNKLAQKDGQDYGGADRFNFSHIVDIEARNRATHQAVIPTESTANLAHASLMAFLEAVHLLELPAAEQQRREEHYMALLIRQWAKGFLTPQNRLDQQALAAELELSSTVTAHLNQQVQHDLKAAIDAYENSRTPNFEGPELREYVTEKHNLPSVLANQLHQGLRAYLKTTFPVNGSHFEGLIDRFLDSPDQVLRGPYLSLSLPFAVNKDDPTDYFPEIAQPYKPYLHQEDAYARLTTERPQPTLVATGTGSGKTECFLYPVVHHCYQQRHQPGIKAILIYPMNALATDQARRLAGLIWNNPALKGQINAGLYVGDKSGQPAVEMRADSLITDRDVMRNAPPDILLTNYKMLDLLLTRPEDHLLWRDNGPQTLQFVIVDEIHTFDGAQGTDLACLLRRLKSRLRMPAGHLCPVGTSATLGKENRNQILDYASQIFGEPFDKKALIQEQRESMADFLVGASIAADRPLYTDWIDVLDPSQYGDYATYIQAQYKFWFGESLPETPGSQNWRVQLGQSLKGLRFFQNFVRVLHGKHLTREQVISQLAHSHPELKTSATAFHHALLDSLMALISTARSIPLGFEGHENPSLMPFLQVRAQLWMRELRRLVASVHAEQPEIRFADDHPPDTRAYLPLVHCRDCHNLAWAARRHPHKSQYIQGLIDFYTRYRSGKKDLWLLYPDPELSGGNLHLEALQQWLCPRCLMTDRSREDFNHAVSCPGESLLAITALPLFSEENGSGNAADCQLCGGQGSLNIMGHRASSLTSVMIAEVFGSAYSDDKKIIAFSDSVQDASYRAGFFTARTYAFTLRTALQQYFATLPPAAALPLTQLAAGFSDHWLQQYTAADYISQFFPADMTWIRDYEEFIAGNGTPDENSSLLPLVDQRLNWEIYRELTFRSRVGRTLEKAGLAMVSLPLNSLDPVVAELMTLLPNEFPQLTHLIAPESVPGALRHTLAMLFMHLKQVGSVYFDGVAAVFHQHLPYQIYAHAKGFPKPLWMPRHQGFSGPRPLTLNNAKVEALQLQNRTSWYQWLIEKMILTDAAIFERRDRDSLLRCLLDSLTRHKLLLPCDKDAHVGWAINPEKMLLSTSVVHLQCLDCQHKITVPAVEIEAWTHQPCGRRPCENGRYSPSPADQRADYYHSYYTHANPQRIFAAEHTGLLSRPVREAVEHDFMADKASRKEHPWYTNLLSSTPTLEMGIDIGDLSTVLLCSVPPNPSNYIQRIGRSGRSDGNSLNVTVAAGRPHDLYYFREPLDMIDGQVQTPGVFLGAAAVLERQLTAYCFDRWVESGIGPDAIDKKFSAVMQTLSQSTPNPARFPYNLLAFITSHQTEIFEGFMGLFGDEMPADQRHEIREHLLAFLEGEDEGALSYKILERMTHLAQECSNYKRDIEMLKARIKKQAANPALDASSIEELERMRQEAEGLRGILKQIRNKQVFNLLTDEGLLPNYAFPEEGITLRSVIYRKLPPADGQSKHYETMEYEYVRPAATALAELAPNNYFYAGGRRVRINQVELRFGELDAGTNVRTAGFELWRFCDQCSHMSIEIESAQGPAKHCPKCGSAGWQDVGQLQRLIRMRQVFANTNIQDSLHLDSSEDRGNIFFEKELLVQFEPEDVMQAYRLKDDSVAFGFEFIRKVKLRDINFGESQLDSGDGHSQSPRLSGQGFLLCKSCGMVQHPTVLTRSATRAQHAITCRRPRETPTPQDLFTTSFLYREFQSEALRLFLPDDARFNGEICRQSFVAAVHLGLKHYFGGNIDHLSATVQTEGDSDNHEGRHFLVLYDQVPGGTGYLKQLAKLDLQSAQPVLRQVLGLALAHLRACACQQEAHVEDGCYRCILTYRQAHQIKNLSRITAIELLAMVLNDPDGFVATANLSGLRPNGLQESELERRFLEAFRREGNALHQTHKLRLIPDVVNGKLGYLLQVNDYRYSIEPQVSLGPEQGVAVPSRADFVIRSLQDEAFLPVVIYTDGFAHHHNRLGIDTAQRMALIHSGKYLTWSLSWNDVDMHISPQVSGDYAWNTLPLLLSQSPFFHMLQAGPAPLNAELARMLSNLRQQSPFNHLIHYLAHPQRADWARLGDLLMLERLQSPQTDAQQSAVNHRQFKEALMNQAPAAIYDLYKEAEGLLYFPELIQSTAELPSPRAYLAAQVRLPQQRLFNADAGGQLQWVQLDDSGQTQDNPDFQIAWNGYLRLLNLLQFVPQSWFVTVSGLDQDLYDPILEQLARQAEPQPALNDAWQTLSSELCELEHEPLILAMATQNCALPTLGYEPATDSGEVLGMIEFAFVSQRFGLVLPDAWEEMQQPDRWQALQSQGWKLIQLSDDLLNDPENLIHTYAKPMGAST